MSLSTNSFLALIATMSVAAACALAEPEVPTALDARTRNQTISALAKAIEDTYAFPDLGAQIARLLRQRQRRGLYDAIPDARALSERLTSELAELSHDPHLRVMYSPSVFPAMDAETPDPQLQRQTEQRLRKRNFAYDRVERLTG